MLAHNRYFVLAVNAANQDSLADAARFVEQRNLSFPILLIETAVSRPYEVRSLPTPFVDRDGIIREIVVGGPMAEALLRVRAEQPLVKPLMLPTLQIGPLSIQIPDRS
jgi:hypothetical protein